MEQQNRKIHLSSDILKYFDHLYDTNSSEIDVYKENQKKNYDKQIKEQIYKNGFLSTLNEDQEILINDDQCQLNWNK